MADILIIFTKNLIYGKVKTRIAKVIGAEGALYLYKMLLDQLKSTVNNLPSNIKTRIYYSAYIDPSDKWPRNERYWLQRGNDLGQRMANATEESIINPNDKAILIGSDIVGFTVDIVEKAFEILNTKDIVIGPAQDGGYYLIGMKKFYPEVFEGITWSTDKVFESTVDAIRAQRLSYGVLPVLRDVDEVDDIPEKFWVKIKNHLKN